MRKLCAEPYGVDQCKNQNIRSFDELNKETAEHRLNHGNVACHSCDKGRNFDFVNIFERKILNLVEKCTSHVCAEAHTCDGTAPRGNIADYKRQQTEAEHLK